MNEYLEAYLSCRDYASVTDQAIEWIRTWFAQNGPDSPAVIGISGGKDSTVVAALCAEALGRDRVFGIRMPNGVQSDIDVARRVTEHLGIPSAEINSADGYRGVEGALAASGIELSQQARINLSPRLRMSVLYAAAQCRNGRVSNNGNRSECYVGYFTIYGDGAGDFSPLSNLTVTEVRLVGACLGLPAEFVQKPPSDGLSGKTDEASLGFSYEALDTYILTGICPDAEIRAAIDRKHFSNLFKRKPIASFSPSFR